MSNGLLIVSPVPANSGGGATNVNIAGWFGATTPTVGQKAMAASIPVVIASDQTQFPAALVDGRFDVNNGAWLGSTAPTVGQKTMANSIPVVIASDQAGGGGTGLGVNVTGWFGAVTPTVGQKTMAASLPVTPASDYQRQGVTAAAAVQSNTTNTLPLAQYNASAPTLTTAQVAALQSDVNGNLKNREQYAPIAEDNTNGVIATMMKPLAVSTYCFLTVFSTALATNLVIKASAGVIRSISGRIDATATTATYYIMLWNLAALPANATAVIAGNSLMAPFKVQHTSGSDDRFNFDFSQNGIFGSAGLVIGLSTTEFTQTAAGSFLSASAEYI